MAHDFAPQRTIDFAISASVLKLMIQHDANVVSEKEIEQRNKSAEIEETKRFREYIQDSRRNKT